MAIVTERDRNRLATLLLAIRPPHSLAARLDALSSDDRTHYERWQARYDDWFERCRAQHDDDIEIDARPYARLLDDHGPPALSRNVETALFGNMPHVTIDMTDEQIKRLYDDYLETAR